MKNNYISITIPGSTANLGPGFDTLALALGIYTTVNFMLVDKDDKTKSIITLKGSIAQSLPTDSNNLMYKVLSQALAHDHALLQKIRIEIESDVPLSAGLGSSGTAILAGLWAAHHFSGRTIDKAKLLAEAVAWEGHPDNLAASLYGGLVISCPSLRPNHIITHHLSWPEKWNTLVVVPAYKLATEKARSILPKHISMQDAVFNIQRSTLLTAAIYNQDEDSLQEALHDRLHQPYRETLMPELGLLRKELSTQPILGCVLSGAGPSVLIIVNQQHKAAVLKHLQNWSASQKQPAQILDLKVDHQGFREIDVAVKT